MLFSYVILCDFFPLYEYQCVLSTEEQHTSENALGNRSMTMESEEQRSTKYGLQQHDRPKITEIVLAVWVFTLFCEEIRQVREMDFLWKIAISS